MTPAEAREAECAALTTLLVELAYVVPPGTNIGAEGGLGQQLVRYIMAVRTAAAIEARVALRRELLAEACVSVGGVGQCQLAALRDRGDENA